MKAPYPIKIDILKMLLTEDRTEVRNIRESIYRLVLLLVGGSFAITAFVYKDAAVNSHRACIAAISDLLLLVCVWVVFLRLMADLVHARRALKGRQDILRNLAPADDGDFEPFADMNKVEVDIKDDELWLMPVLATVVIVAEAVVTAALL